MNNPFLFIRRSLILLILLCLPVLATLYYLRWLQNQKSAVATHPPPTPRTLQTFQKVPTFELTERSGKKVTLKSLEGNIWVANFIFTRCPGPCRTLTLRMQSLQTRVAAHPNVRLVTFTVDPENDTPAVLKKYATQFSAANYWLFLTGKKKPMHDLIQKGFLQVIARNSEELAASQGEYVHSTRMILVDAHGMIRGFYDGLLDNSVDHVMEDISILEKESGL